MVKESIEIHWNKGVERIDRGENEITNLVNCVSVRVSMQDFRVFLCEAHVERVVLLCAKRDDILFLSLDGQFFLSLRESWQKNI